MTAQTATLHPLRIDRPVVVLPAEEYRMLLAEAGYLPTPHLDRMIQRARANFRKGKTIPWSRLRHELG